MPWLTGAFVFGFWSSPLPSVIGYVVLSYLSLFGVRDPGLGVDDDRGYVVIDDVDRDGAAAAAGLAAGDRVLSANGQRVANLADWLALRTNFVADQAVPISVERNGRQIDLAMTLHGTEWSLLSATSRATAVIFLSSKLITLVRSGCLIIFSRPRDFVGVLGGSVSRHHGDRLRIVGRTDSRLLCGRFLFLSLWPVMLVHVSAAIRTPLLFTFFALFPRKAVPQRVDLGAGASGARDYYGVCAVPAGAHGLRSRLT